MSDLPKPPAAEYEFGARLQKLLVVCGSPAKCKACGADIYWLKTRNDKMIPYTPEGLPHFADCPRADVIKRGKKIQQAREKNEAG